MESNSESVAKKLKEVNEAFDRLDEVLNSMNVPLNKILRHSRLIGCIHGSYSQVKSTVTGMDIWDTYQLTNKIIQLVVSSKYDHDDEERPAKSRMKVEVTDARAARSSIKCEYCGRMGHSANEGKGCYKKQKDERHKKREEEEKKKIEPTKETKTAKSARRRLREDTSESSGDTSDASTYAGIATLESVAPRKEAKLTYAQVVKKNSLQFTVDSGATHHFTMNEDGMKNVKKTGGSVRVANGKSEKLTATGDIPGKLEGILVSAKFDERLLSVPQMVLKGYTAIFDKTGVKFIENKFVQVQMTKEPMLEGPLIGHKFQVEVPTQNEKTKAERECYTAARTKMHVEDRCQLWLARTGYPHPLTTMEAAKNPASNLRLPKGVTEADFQVADLDAYQMGKMSKRPHFSKKGDVTERDEKAKPFATVCIDIEEMECKSYGLAEYSLKIVDLYSRAIFVLPLKKKSDLVPELRSWYRTVVRPAGFKINYVKMDNATEQKSCTWKDFCEDEEIASLYTSAYSSASNGVVERSHRTISEGATCMKIAGQFEDQAWAELQKTKAYLHRKLPNSRNPGRKSPYEMITGRAPSLAHLKAIGCKAYTLIEYHNREGALPAKARTGKFIGYKEDTFVKNEDTSQYRIIFPGGRIVTTRDVRFSEKFSSHPGDAGRVVSTGNKKGYVEWDMPLAESTAAETFEKSDSTEEETTANDSGEAVTGDNTNYISEELLPENDPPLRRSERTRRAPERLDAQLAQNICAMMVDKVSPLDPPDIEEQDIEDDGDSDSIPQALKAVDISDAAAMRDPRFRAAMRDEIQNLTDLKAWKLTKLPKGRKAIDVRWAHALKEDKHGHFERARSRICPKGFQQKAGLDYNPREKAAPTMDMDTAHLMCIIQVQEEMDAEILDGNTAFATTAVKEDIYMKRPAGVRGESDDVLQLLSSLNGLVQSSYNWHQRAEKCLTKAGFKSSIFDTCLYYKKDEKGKLAAMVGLYVDDFRIIYKDKKYRDELVGAMDFGVKQADSEKWLGMHIEHDKEEGKLTISMKAYIEQLLKEFKMESCKPVKNPMEPGVNLDQPEPPLSEDKQFEKQTFKYREAIGALLWLARTGMPQLMHSVNKLAQYSHKVNYIHVVAVKRVFRYIQGAKDELLTYRRNPEGYKARALCDANFAGEPVESMNPMKSTSSIALYYQGIGLMKMFSKLQTVVAKSTFEAEFTVTGITCQMIEGNINFHKEVGLPLVDMPVVYNDNQAAVLSYRNGISSAKARHIQVQHHYGKELVKQGKLDIQYVSTTDNTADIGTKALAGPAFSRHANTLLYEL